MKEAETVRMTLVSANFNDNCFGPFAIVGQTQYILCKKVFRHRFD